MNDKKTIVLKLNKEEYGLLELVAERLIKSKLILATESNKTNVIKKCINLANELLYKILKD